MSFGMPDAARPAAFIAELVPILNGYHLTKDQQTSMDQDSKAI
jgi:hypothetical protein